MRLALINDPEHWRSCAEEARTIADDIKDAEVRRMMLSVAEAYDQLADRAQERILTGGKQP
jgi:hypothetical protein